MTRLCAWLAATLPAIGARLAATLCRACFAGARVW